MKNRRSICLLGLSGLLLLTSACCRREEEKRALAPLPEGEQAVRLLVLRGRDGAALALIPVYINDQGPFSFALDTGASHSLIDSSVVNRLNLPIGQQNVQISGVIGISEAAPVKVEKWHVGEVALPPSVLVTLQMPRANEDVKLDGLFGSDILSRFGVLQIDYDNQILIFRPGSGRAGK